MSAASVLVELRTSGVEVVAENDMLHFRPVELVTAAQRDALIRHKAELIATLIGNEDRNGMNGGPLQAAVVIRSCGEDFVLLPTGADPLDWCDQGAPISVEEIDILGRATGGEPLDDLAVKVLAATMKVFPDVQIDAARLLGAANGKEGS